MEETEKEEGKGLFGLAERPFDASILPAYLGQIRHAAQRLAGHASAGDVTQVTDLASAIHEIAQALVQACRPSLIASDSRDDLPEIPILVTEHDLPIATEEDEQESLPSHLPYLGTGCRMHSPFRKTYAFGGYGHILS